MSTILVNQENAHQSATKPRIGLIAGWGRYPIVVSEALQKQGFSVFTLGIKDHADASQLSQLSDTYQEIGIARLGSAVRFFHRHGVGRATMAGKIQKTLLFQRGWWLKHFPDARFIRSFYPHFITLSRNRNDDTMLGTFVEAFAKAGITFAPATDFAPDLLITYGHLSGRRLSRSQQKDIEFGWQLAREMGRLDVGQSVAVKGRAVLAIEAVEGTDECIRRAGELCPVGDFTVVKVAKPQQDMRFDVPTIGLGTLQTMVDAKARVLAVEAERTIVIDRSEVIAFAQKQGITIVAVQNSLDQSAPKAA